LGASWRCVPDPFVKNATSATEGHIVLKEGQKNIRRPGGFQQPKGWSRRDPVSCNWLKALDEQPSAVVKRFRLDPLRC
jgi:hypothetical protein